MNDIQVATTGSDESGLGTPSAPYRTLGKAVGALSHGRRIIVQPGEYVETAPLVLNSIEQARVVAVERGSTVVQVADGVTTPNVLTLLNCYHCVVEGFSFRNHPGNAADGGAIGVTGGAGNLISDLSVAWTATGLPSSTALSLIQITSSPNTRVRRGSLRDITVSGSGVLVGIRVTDSHVDLVDCAITAATRGSATCRGVLIEGTTAMTARIERVRIQDLETWSDLGSPPDCIGIRVDVAGAGAIHLVLRDVMVARPRSLGITGSVFKMNRAAGIRVACQDAVDVEGLILAECGVGFDGVDVPNPSSLNRVTAHQCDTAIRSGAPTPPSRYVVRNLSLSECTNGLSVLGTPGSTFFDIDFTNFYRTDHWFTGPDPLASSFEVGSHISEFIPLYVDPKNLDFSLANVSGLINRGGDF